MSRLKCLKPRIAEAGSALTLGGGTARGPNGRHVPHATTTQRGYGWAWQQLRERILARDGGLCQACLRVDRVSAAAEVDHIVPKLAGGRDDEDNLQSLCSPCHRMKTAKDLGLATDRARGEHWGWVEYAERQAYAHTSDAIGALLHPPTLRPAAGELTIVAGPAAAGKTTFIEANATADDIVIDMDRIRVELGIGSDDWNRETLERSLKRRNSMLESLGTSRKRAWFIVSAPSAQERAWWSEKLKPSRFVLVLTPLQTCYARIRATRSGSRAQRSLDAAASWWSSYTPRAGDEVIPLNGGALIAQNSPWRLTAGAPIRTKSGAPGGIKWPA